MCGIIGYIGKQDAQSIIINGLKKLEYRGYDSAGISLINDKNQVIIKKTQGKIANLESILNHKDNGKIGIGHTRWATHGKPSDINSHPHVSNNAKFSVVHNGIIENHEELKNMLVQEGYSFASETDSEVVPVLLEKYNQGNLLEAVRKVIEVLQGSYALCVISSDYPEEILVVRKESPLIIGLGEEENFIASDIPAILEHTKKIFVLEDDEIGVVSAKGVVVYDSQGKLVDKKLVKVNWSLETAEKQGYPHFMLKEIFEQPGAVRKTLAGRIKEGTVNLDLDIEVDKIDKIAIVACGTANYAGQVAAYIIQSRLRIPVLVNFASEFRYMNPLVDENTLTIVISQSGETADTLAGLREAKSKGSKILTITNVLDSSIPRESDYVIYTQAGPEISVASTKAYITQLIALYLFILDFGYRKEILNKELVASWLSELEAVPEKIEEILNRSEVLEGFAKNIKDAASMFFIGRGLDSVSCLEGALKLKEISYIHAEAYPAGELKHGTLALITKAVPVMAIATSKKLVDKTISNISEVKTREAITYCIAFKNVRDIKDVDYLFTLPDIIDELAPILTVVPLQLLAYYTAVLKGNDVDHPRNLAKSVTVE
ncbi:MAG: glutamine--fructose-6-phosphate transaminase (isomerizing) [Fusobacteria bacterium]|nr:glutamine--fructose-6-phosphate transaminase (isomerizing) [Fusobacteriota bacterium]